MRKPIIAGNWKMNKTRQRGARTGFRAVPLVKDAKCVTLSSAPRRWLLLL